MGNLLSYSGITTKIRALKSKLISREEYQELASLSSVPEAFAFLKNHPGYRELLADADENQLHRGDIEKLLTRSVYSDFTKIYRFSNVKQRVFLNLYFQRYEIQILKTCLRMVFDHKDVVLDLSQFKEFFDRHSRIDITKLYISTSIEDLVLNLKGSCYYEPLFMLSTLDNPTLFDYEMALDLYYFSYIWNKKDKLFKKEALQIITHSYGHKLDMLNIQWIYRSKKYYNMSSADIYAILIPCNYKLNKSQITNMVEAASIEELSVVLKSTYYAKHYEEIDAVTLEEMYISILDKVHLEECRKNPYSIASLRSYLYEKEHEIDKLTTAFECIRYGLEPRKIINYLVK